MTAVRRWAALTLAASLLAAIAAVVLGSASASAQDGDQVTAPAAPEGYELVAQDDLQKYDLPAGAVILGEQGAMFGAMPTAPKSVPPGYTQVVRSGVCVSLGPGNGQSCQKFVYAVPEGGPTEGAKPAQAPELPSVGTGAPGEGTYGFDDKCESMSKDKGSWLSPSQGIARVFGNVSEMGCKVANVVTHPGDALQKMWDSQFGQTVKSLIAGVADGWGTMLNWFFNQAAPKISDAQYLDVLQSYFLPIQGIVLVLSIVIACIRIALAPSGNETVAAMDLARTMIRTITSMGLFGAVLALSIQMADALSVWLVSEAGGNDLSSKVEGMLLNDNSTWGPGWVLLIALFGMAGAFIQTVLLVVRSAFLMVIVGVLPLAAAASGSEMGSQSYEKMRNWAIAFVLLKPATAAVMAVAFWAADPDSDVSRLQGLILLSVAAVAMPALLRLMNVSTSDGGGHAFSSALGAAGGAGLALAGGGGMMAALAGRGSRAVVGAAARSSGGPTGNQSGGGSGGGGGGGGNGGGGGGGTGGGARARGGSVGRNGSAGSGLGSAAARRSSFGGAAASRAMRSGVQTARAGAQRSGSSLDRLAHDIANDAPARPFSGGGEVLR